MALRNEAAGTTRDQTGSRWVSPPTGYSETEKLEAEALRRPSKKEEMNQVSDKETGERATRHFHRIQQPPKRED